MADTPLSAQMESDYKVAKWNRNTVADGSWLQKYTIEKLKDRDIFLANNIDSAIGDLTSALDTEKAARIEGDEYISAALTSVSSDFYDFSGKVEQSASNITNTINVFSGKVEQSASDLNSALNFEVERATTAEEKLQDQIDTLEAATDVIMVYGTYSSTNSADPTFVKTSGDLWEDPGYLTENDVIKILIDNSDGNSANQTYYQATNVDHETSSCLWTKIGSLEPYYSITDLNNAAGTNINITTADGIKINTNDNVVFSSVSSIEFSGTNISSLNLYIPSANNGARSVTEISSNSTGISAHIVDPMVNEVITASWASIINAANDPNEYVPLTAEECEIGNDNSASNYSLTQGTVNSAKNYSFTQGSNNIANSNALAQGISNSADSNSIAQGYGNSARSYSLAFGKNSQAHRGGFAFSPDLWEAQTKPSLASGNSFAFGNGCTAEINAFAMGDNCSAVSGGFAYGMNCTASSNSIAIGEGMFSKAKQISLGYYGSRLTADSNKIVFHVGYGSGPEFSSRRDIFSVTTAGTIASFDAGDSEYNPQKEAVKLNSQFFEAPREFGRIIPMRLTQGLSMATGVNIDVKTYPGAFTARHNILFGNDAEGYSFNMWIPSTTGSASQEFTLTKAACATRGVYRLTVGVHKSYSIMFKNFNPNTGSQTDRIVIKTGVANTGSWPAGGTTAYYDHWNYFLDKDSATSNTYFNFPVIPCDDIITFIVDGASRQFIMIKGQG